MRSKLLEKHGLLNRILHKPYSLRLRLDGKEGIKNNMEGFLKEENISYPSMLYSGVQVHGTNIEYCDGTRGTYYAYGKIFKDTDGLITDKKDIGLVIKFADCTPIVIYDKEKNIQASLHSGWRSTRSGILAKALDIFIKDYKSQVQDLLVYIGPTIDQDSYEVGPEVYDEFKKFKTRDQFFRPKDSGKYDLDLSQAHIEILKDYKLQPDQVEVSNMSTYLNLDLHSARRSGGKDYGLNAIVSIIK